MKKNLFSFWKLIGFSGLQTFLFSCFFLISFHSWGQVLTENFTTGLPSSYTTGNIVLNSGNWNGTDVINGSGVAGFSGNYCQLRSATGSQITSPVIATGGISTIQFKARGSATTNGIQVNYRINGGSWTAATGSPSKPRSR